LIHAAKELRNWMELRSEIQNRVALCSPITPLGSEEERGNALLITPLSASGEGLGVRFCK